ncbi:MAG: 3-oxoacid CoA-transferase subunit A [Rhodospirillales bacterium]|nr:3-oxoacid CoA-transferase subunit A [Rhodospirillales bacterium]
MIDKQVPDLAAALEGVEDGSVVLVGGFGDAGVANDLVQALVDQGAKNLTLVGNGAISEVVGHGRLIVEGRVDKFIASFPKGRGSSLFEPGDASENVELEIVPQGTLAERIRAAGAGIPGFYTATSFGTPLGEGKEVKEFDGENYVLERAIKADVALIKARTADRWGNLTYAKTARNFNPIMAMAAKMTIVQVSEIVELGEIDPEQIVTPGIFVDRVVLVADDLREESRQ